MSIELPLYRQEEPNTCALACLRMVLAAEASLEPGGTAIDELERLAHRFGLGAEVRETSVEDLRRILAEGRLPIAYLDRALFDLPPRRRARHSIRAAVIHTVIPSRVTAATVTFHDPLPPKVTRRSIALFRQAPVHLGSMSVICWKKA